MSEPTKKWCYFHKNGQKKYDLRAIFLLTNLNSSYLAGNVAGQPVQALVQSLTCCSTSALDIPVSLAKGVQSKLISDLSSIHSVWQILLVSKDKQHSIT
jgi:hypothetical protein